MDIPSKTQLLILGAGPGGYTAAFYAADLGLEVTLIDADDTPGGVCLHRGCIPSKALLHAAQILAEAKEAEGCGIEFGAPRVNLDKLRNWKNGVVTKLGGGLSQLCRQRRITFIQGRACFVEPHIVKIQTPDEAEHHLNFDKAILAAGSSPVQLPHLPHAPCILSSTTALQLDNIPRSLLVVGGGYIGLELGSAYAQLGSKVCVAEMLPCLLSGVDRDLVTVLERRMKTTFQSVLLQTKVSKVTETASGLRTTLEDKNGRTVVEEYEKILVAAGRRPNTQNMGLENTGVSLDDDDFVVVNAQRMSRDPSIYAVGDVTGQPMLAHKAAREARVAVDTIAGEKNTFAPKAIPAVVFTDPEIAWCGLTETEAKEKNIAVNVAKFPWAASGRALTLNRHDGITKLIMDPATEKILGVGLAGTGAGELIAEGVLAVEQQITAKDLASTIHPHPSLSETFMEAAEGFLGYGTHIYRPKKA
jgi:dihydrolipoamide dehydrogenase